MPLMETLEKTLSPEEWLYPFRDIADEKWQYTYENGEQVPSIDFEWREVGFKVKRPDTEGVNFVARNSVRYQVLKGLDTPVTHWNPDFMKVVCGFKSQRRLVEDWTGILTKNADGETVPKPYDPEWLYKRMKAPGGLFIYTSFMSAYNKLMDSVRAETNVATEQDENFS